jgi:hypothetical protein
MDIHEVEYVYVCRSRDFDEFIVPDPSIRPSVRTESEDLLNAMDVIRKKKESAKMESELPAAGINFRKVCYQKEGTVFY